MNKQQISENATGPDWFAAWLPKTDAPPVPAPVGRDPNPNWLDEIRGELKRVNASLLDPSAAGVRGCLPHLERAISLFGAQIPKLKAPCTSLQPAIESLQNELQQATRLFENAYTLQAGWAALIGLNVDGTPQKVLYDRTGEFVPERLGANEADGVWEG